MSGFTARVEGQLGLRALQAVAVIGWGLLWV